jgi:hypothetical protein
MIILWNGFNDCFKISSRYLLDAYPVPTRYLDDTYKIPP